jgi:hypothetical protein
MIVIPAKPDRAKHTEHFTRSIAIAPLSGLKTHFRDRNLGQQPFQQTPSILQQGSAQGAFNPLGWHGLALLQPLLKEPQEAFGFPVAFGLDLLEFFLRSSWFS